MFKIIGALLMAPIIAITALFNPPDYGKEFAQLQDQIIAVEEKLAAQGEEFIAGLAIPKDVAEFQDSLSSPMTASSSSFTLVRGTTSLTGTSLSGTYLFKIDSEHILASCTATACTVTYRGLSDVDLETEVYLQKKSHARGAAVKITDASIVRNSRILNGDEFLPNKLTYDSAFTFNTGNELVSKTYADSLTVAGAPDGNMTTKGIYEEASLFELASSAQSGGTTAHLTATSGQFSSQYSANVQRIPVSQTNGLLGGDWIPSASSYSWTGGHTFATATTTFSVTSVFTGSIYASGDAGTAGQVLVSGGNGKASDWKTVTGAVTLVTRSAVQASATTTASTAFNSNTTAYISKVFFPTGIRMDKIFFHYGPGGTIGTWKVGLYSEDGLTQLSSGSTSSVLASTFNTVTTTMTSVVVAAGSYYLAIVPVDTPDGSFSVWDTGVNSAQFSTNSNAFSAFNSSGLAVVNSLPYFEGTQVVGAATLPTTITPKTMTPTYKITPVFMVTSL